jgi:hypothetical protein
MINVSIRVMYAFAKIWACTFFSFLFIAGLIRLK